MLCSGKLSWPWHWCLCRHPWHSNCKGICRVATTVLAPPSKDASSPTSRNLLDWLPSGPRNWIYRLLQPWIFVFLFFIEILFLKWWFALSSKYPLVPADGSSNPLWTKGDWMRGGFILFRGKKNASSFLNEERGWQTLRLPSWLCPIFSMPTSVLTRILLSNPVRFPLTINIWSPSISGQASHPSPLMYKSLTCLWQESCRKRIPLLLMFPVSNFPSTDLSLCLLACCFGSWSQSLSPIAIESDPIAMVLMKPSLPF